MYPVSSLYSYVFNNESHHAFFDNEHVLTNNQFYMRCCLSYLVPKFAVNHCCSMDMQVVTRSNGLLTLDLVQHDENLKATHPRSCGKLTVHAEESINSKITTELLLRCSDLENKDLFSKSVWN